MVLYLMIIKLLCHEKPSGPAERKAVIRGTVAIISFAGQVSVEHITCAGAPFVTQKSVLMLFVSLIGMDAQAFWYPLAA
jgi:hypothetical protein